MNETQDSSESESQRTDPRVVLAHWANSADEWVRFIVRCVLTSGSAATEDEINAAYGLFREEKGLDDRVSPEQPEIAATPAEDDSTSLLTIKQLSEVQGVNALVPGSQIEPHEGLTILYGENGTGKTGYSRIFKALADSRTADEILSDIAVDEPEPASAHLVYELDGVEHDLDWKGETGIGPFVQMSIFDSPSVSFHVDEDLEYVYVPAVLALFEHVSSGIKSVQAKIESRIAELSTGSSVLLNRFPRRSTIYPLIETLGASTDLIALRLKADTDSDQEQRVETLRRAVGALEADALGTTIRVAQSEEKSLRESIEVGKAISDLDVAAFNASLTRRAALVEDQKKLSAELFQSADLPSEPDSSWQSFIASGQQYRNHLEEKGSHDSERCLYCRQPLSTNAADLISKYSGFLEDKISSQINDEQRLIEAAKSSINGLTATQSAALVDEYRQTEGTQDHVESVAALCQTLSYLKQQMLAEEAIDPAEISAVEECKAVCAKHADALATQVKTLSAQNTNRKAALVKKQSELTELEAAIELGLAWPAIEQTVNDSKEKDRLQSLSKALPNLGRSVTDMSKAASDQLVNESFDELFLEECKLLLAPELKLDFVGKQGKARRRKSMLGKYKPSKVLSEGEQKVLAIADFLAEARLAGIRAPVIFDDPVSSLDHRRIKQVAARVADLATTGQVIVFTHDILFATNLMALFEESKRCTLYQITDDDGKGYVSRATGLRWDTLKFLKGKINETIQAAQSSEGEARSALVRVGYDWIRSWCEVFAEMEMLEGVSQRYQPNVRMGALPKLKTESLPGTIEVVDRIFNEACRFIPGHSQPLATLTTAPKLADLEAHWKELTDCRTAFLNASS